jgi:hypothetical protein
MRSTLVAVAVGLTLVGSASAQSTEDVKRLFGHTGDRNIEFVPVDTSNAIVPAPGGPGGGGAFPGSLFKPIPAIPFPKLFADRPLPTPFTGPTAGNGTALPALPNQSTIRGIERQHRRNRRREAERLEMLQQQGAVSPPVQVQRV